MKKLILISCAAALSFLSACDEQQDTPVADTQASRPLIVDYAARHQAALVRSLPSKSIAYFRIPNLAGMLNTAQADALYPAISHQSLQTQGTSILEGINTNLISKIEEPEIRRLADLLINKQAAPIEVAVLAGIGGAMTPEVMLQTRLNLADINEFKVLLEQVVASSQNQVQLSEGPDEHGNFRLNAGPISTFGYFDAGSKDFVIYGGPTVIESNLSKYREGTLEKREDLLSFEQQFDTSGGGFSLWADTDTLWQQLSPMAPPEIRPQLEAFNLQDSKFIYAGSAAKNGHGSMRIHLQYKEDGENMLHFAASEPALEALIAPPLNFAASLPMPNQQHLAQAIKLDNRFNSSPELENAVAKAETHLKQEYQIDLNQLLGAFGGSVSVVSDRAGTWASLPIKNDASFDALIATTQNTFGATQNKNLIAGTEITHYVFPGLTKLALTMNPDNAASANDLSAPLMQVLSGENMHLYWVREGNNLIVAGLPQILLARERHKTDATLSQWLANNDINRSSSLLSLTANAENLPRTAYHMYLSGIQSLSDVAGVQPNLGTMPLAEDLGLPDTGRLGIAINTGKTETSLTMEYAQSPLDYLMGGNAMAAVAVTGVLAAVAIPAYKDYTIRAKINEVLGTAGRIQFSIAEYYNANNELPLAGDLAESSAGNEMASIFYDDEEGIIRIVFSQELDTRLSEGELQLIPDLDNDRMQWVCSNISAPESLIPMRCRN